WPGHTFRLEWDRPPPSFAPQKIPGAPVTNVIGARVLCGVIKSGLDSRLPPSWVLPRNSREPCFPFLGGGLFFVLLGAGKLPTRLRDHFPRCRVPPNKATLSGYHRNVGDSSIENVEVVGEVRHKCHTPLGLRLRTNQATARACSSSLRLTKFELVAASSLLRQRAMSVGDSSRLSRSFFLRRRTNSGRAVLERFK